MTPVILAFATWICSPNYREECIAWVDQCMIEGLAEGFAYDEAEEYCSENIPPEWVGFAWMPQ